MKKDLPLPQALAWIVASVFCITGPIYLAVKHHRAHAAHPTPPTYIRAILQTGPQREALKTECLAELLGLSFDRPTVAKTFDLKAAKERLLAHPLISSAICAWNKPDTLRVDYAVRQPMAWWEDFENVVIDKEGRPFPFSPFFSPKNLPKVYAGCTEFAGWETPFSGPLFALSVHLLQLTAEPDVQAAFTVKRIDVSNAFAESYGRREIVLLIEDLRRERGGVPCLCLLRLSTKHYAQELGNYLELRKEWKREERREGVRVVDLRIPQLAFVEP